MMIHMFMIELFESRIILEVLKISNLLYFLLNHVLHKSRYYK